MPAYSYQALDAKGKKVKGVLEGDSERQVRTQLRGRDLKPLEVKTVRSRAVTTGNTSSSFTFGSPKMKPRELSLFTRQLASLVLSGLPLDEVLAAAARQTKKPAVKSIVLQVRSRVVEGLSLNQALSELPKVFDNLYRAMIKAGESSGYLGPVLEQLAEYTERSQETAHKVKSAMIYPVVMVIFSGAIVTALMVFVVPQLIGLFENNGRELPFITRALITTSNVLVNYGIFIVIAVVGSFVFFRKSWLKDEKRKYAWHAFLLKVPVLGAFLLQAETARYASTLGLLAKSGVPLLEGLKIATQVLENRVLKDASQQVAVMVQEGASMSKALDHVDVFPPLLVQMVASGEANGKLSEQLEYSARNQQRELEFSVSAAMSLMEPAMIIMMAVMVGFIVIAILLPIFEMNDIAGI